jgi:hypothetical protein
MAYGTVNAEQMTTQSGYTLGAGNSSSFKNRIINGNMTIAQRATSSNAVSGGGYTTLDRWNLFQNLGAMNIAQSSTAPTGFSNSMQFTVSTAASQTSSASSVVAPNQSIEGFNTADLMWGTANAKSITVSVWVYSNLVGQYAIWIRNSAADRFYSTPFTITTANTWQQVTATIAGDTSGTWVGATNGIGLTIGICLAAGSGRVGAGNTWSGSSFYGVTGQVDWQATASNTFYFTGFQLEVGTVATSFDYRSVGTELALCQRYFQIYKGSDGAFNNYTRMGYGYFSGTGSALCYITNKVNMRTQPSITASGSFTIYNGTFYTILAANITQDGATSSQITGLSLSGSSWPGAGVFGDFITNSSATSYLAISAEL